MAVALYDIRPDCTQSLCKIALKMAQGFSATAVIHLICGATRSVTLFGAATAAFGTLVDAAVRPIFQKLFRESRFVANVSTLAVSSAVAVSVAVAVAPAVGTTFVVSNVVLSVLAFFLINQNDRVVAHVY